MKHRLHREAVVIMGWGREVLDFRNANRIKMCVILEQKDKIHKLRQGI